MVVALHVCISAHRHRQMQIFIHVHDPMACWCECGWWARARMSIEFITQIPKVVLVVFWPIVCPPDLTDKIGQSFWVFGCLPALFSPCTFRVRMQPTTDEQRRYTKLNLKIRIRIEFCDWNAHKRKHEPNDLFPLLNVEYIALFMCTLFWCSRTTVLSVDRL